MRGKSVEINTLPVEVSASWLQVPSSPSSCSPSSPSPRIVGDGLCGPGVKLPFQMWGQPLEAPAPDKQAAALTPGAAVQERSRLQVSALGKAALSRAPEKGSPPPSHKVGLQGALSWSPEDGSET